MHAFARLLEDLSFAPGEEARLAHLAAYFSTAPDPDRGWALAALRGDLALPSIRPARIRGLLSDRVDPVLFELSHDFVGDVAETVALIWPGAGEAEPPPLGDVVQSLAGAGAVDLGRLLVELLDRLDVPGRLALIRLVTGGVRPAVSTRLLSAALAQAGGADPGRGADRFAPYWHCLSPPYPELFTWLGGGPAPTVATTAPCRPAMPVRPLDEALLDAMAPGDYLAEWQWSGLRVQAVALGGARRLFTRWGDEIGAAFPEIIEAMDWRGAVDAVLTLLADGAPAPVADVDARLGRKRVTAKLLTERPAHLLVHDLLHDGTEDLRAHTLEARRIALDRWISRYRPARATLSAEIVFNDWVTLADLRGTGRSAGREGLVIKRRAAPYASGPDVEPWYGWPFAPLSAKCVLVYAERDRGQGRTHPGSLTIAAWRDGSGGPELVPVGKATAEGTEEERAALDRWVHENTFERYGPVRAVVPEVVLDVVFDAVERAARRKSGIVLRAPRVRRILWEMPADAADQLDTLIAMIPGPEP